MRSDNVDEPNIDDDDAVLAEGGPLDDGTLVIGDAVITQADVPAFDSEQDLDALYGEDEDEEDLGEDDLDLGDEYDVEEPPAPLDHAFEIETPAPERVVKLESAVKQLAGDQTSREQQRLRRKVTAATGGAGAIGFVPIALQLVGALNLTAEVASTVAAVAAAAGALVAGYLTPERQAPPGPAEILAAE
jgi:hypothetical protein